MTITRDEFVRLITARDYKTLRSTDLSGLDAQNLDFSSAGLRYDGFNPHFQLANSNFSHCNLPYADFTLANLQKASFAYAVLSGAVLAQSQCQSANFSYANLSGSDLSDIHLEWADFSHADLSSAFFSFSSVIGVDFTGASFDRHTRLPDDSDWTEDVDMTRFTNPFHPDFWLHPSYSETDLHEFREKYRSTTN
jgi:uncharacterized protein YjbI with pentapeptide repeats